MKRFGREWMAAVVMMALSSLIPGCSTGGSEQAGITTAQAATDTTAPAFGEAFWQHWGDGRGELAAYDLTFPRYGELRHGVAVAIFVTETFSNSLRVKADPGMHPESDEFPVLKLNLVEDFPTGIYDYNLLTSTFVALEPVNGRPAGSVTKASFSAQEWCGHVYTQLLFDDGTARHTLHSYFDGEADQADEIPVPNDALCGDAMLTWARGLAAPLVARGERREVPWVRSLAVARMRHVPVAIGRATLARAAETAHIEVPAGTFEAESCTVEISGGATWTIQVEAATPHRILSWESTDGDRAELLGSDRLAYWKLNGVGGERWLAELGLEPRGRRMP